MTAPDRLAVAPAVAPLLYLPGVAYRAAVGLRNALYDSGRLGVQRLPCLVISLGNLTVGGTGKSPLTSCIASLLRDSGYRVGVVSRGYRRKAEVDPLLVSDGRALLADARSAGDEPYLIARDNPAVPVADLAIDLHDSSPSLTFSANSTHVYLIQTSTNLMSWTTIGTAAPEEGTGNFDYTDFDESDATGRFYRIVTN